MALAGTDWETIVAALAAEPGFGRLAEPDAAAMVWSSDETGRLLWASPGATALGLGLDVDRGTARDLGPAARLRLRDLAGGRAPRSGVRLERLRLGRSSLETPVTLACRMLPLGDREVLVTAVLDAPARHGAPPPEVSHSVATPAGVKAAPETFSDAVPEAAARRGRRFTWRADAAGRLLAFSPDVADGVGSGISAMIGQRWIDLPGAEDLGGREVERVIAEGAAFSRLPVRWRDAATGTWVPVEISGAPLLDRAGAVSGYRGFGQVFPEGADRDARSGKPAVTAESPDRPPASLPKAPSLGAAVEAAAALTGSATDAVFGVLRTWFGPQLNGFPTPRPPASRPPADPPAAPLRAVAPGEAELAPVAAPKGPAGGGLPPRPRGEGLVEGEARGTPSGSGPGSVERRRASFEAEPRSAPQDEDREALRSNTRPEAPPAGPHPAETGLSGVPTETGAAEPDGEALSASERGALTEIARALGEGPLAVEPPAVPERPSAEIVALPPRARPSAPTAVLDRLPIGIAVLRDETPLFANRFLLDLSGHADLPDFVAHGGLAALLGRPLEQPGGESPALVLVTDRSGAESSFEARTATIAWGDLPARLFTIARVPDPLPAAEVRALGLELERRTRRSEELAAALDLAADGVVTLDGQARLLSLGRSAEQLFKVAANEIVGDGFAALLMPQDHRAALACLEKLGGSPEGAVEECEVQGRTRDGRSIPLSMRAARLPKSGEAIFSVAFRDISRFRRLENDLREARGTAERASANRAEFLARISHEIRTPLTAITGFAELMLDERFGPVGSERYRGYIRDIQDSGEHVISLVNDLLDLAKATSGRIELAPTSLDLGSIVQQCVALSGPIAARERTIVRTSFPANLPAIWADERSVRQIVLNILANAIRFTGAGGQVIVSTAARTAGEVVLSIRDTGPGMSPDDIEAALTPFRQVSATRRGDGTGLGLPLSKALAEANGGLFAITSAPTMGTLVEVRLPVSVARVQALAAE